MIAFKGFLMFKEIFTARHPSQKETSYRYLKLLPAFLEIP